MDIGAYIAAARLAWTISRKMSSRVLDEATKVKSGQFRRVFGGLDGSKERFEAAIRVYSRGLALFDDFKENESLTRRRQ